MENKYTNSQTELQNLKDYVVQMEKLFNRRMERMEKLITGSSELKSNGVPAKQVKLGNPPNVLESPFLQTLAGNVANSSTGSGSNPAINTGLVTLPEDPTISQLLESTDHVISSDNADHNSDSDSDSYDESDDDSVIIYRVSQMIQCNADTDIRPVEKHTKDMATSPRFVRIVQPNNKKDSKNNKKAALDKNPRSVKSVATHTTNTQSRDNVTSGDIKVSDGFTLVGSKGKNKLTGAPKPKPKSYNKLEGRANNVQIDTLYVQNIVRHSGESLKEIAERLRGYGKERGLKILSARIYPNRYNEEIVGCRITVPATATDNLIGQSSRVWPPNVTCRRWRNSRGTEDNRESRGRSRSRDRRHGSASRDRSYSRGGSASRSRYPDSNDRYYQNNNTNSQKRDGYESNWEEDRHRY